MQRGLLVAIVNWKAADLTIECLRSLSGEISELPDCHVVVVDNGSPDGSAGRIADAIVANGWDGFATLLALDENRGFAAGNNAAIKAGFKSWPGTEFVLLLNPDTIVRPNAIRLLLEFTEEHRDVGIVGGRSEDPDTTPQHCCFRFPNIVSEFASYLKIGFIGRLLEPHLTHVPIPEQPRPIDWVSGAFMLVRRAVFEQIGLLDESYFLYFEETDFTLRARRAGWLCWHVPEARIVHLVGQTSGVTRRDQPPRRVPGYWFESRSRYFVLNHGRAYAAATDVVVVVACLIARMRHTFQKSAPRHPPSFVLDLLRFSALFRGRHRHRPREIAL